MSEFNVEDISRAMQLLRRDPNDAIELRVLAEKGIFSGYFTDIEKLIETSRRWNDGSSNQYLTINRLHPDCAARCLNRVRWTKRGETTSDKEIIRLSNIYIDCDPLRLSGIASTNDEHAASLEVAIAIREFLRAHGLPEPLMISSGNGHALFLAIDMPPDESRLVKQFLKALATKFNNEMVHVDTTVHNPSRIARLAGTTNHKGENLPHRPHRLARIIDAPEALVPITDEQLKTVIEAIKGCEGGSLAKELSPPDHSTRVEVKFDIAGWLSGLEVAYDVTDKADGTQYNLRECPFKPAGHAAGGAAIFQHADGRITASCFHAKCKWGWPELRLRLDPAFDDRAEKAAVRGTEGVRDPHRLARLVLAAFDHPEHPTITLYNGAFFLWQDGAWKEQHDRDIRRIITRVVKAEFDRYTAIRRSLGADVMAPQVTTNLVGNVMNALNSIVEPASLAGPDWLTKAPWPLNETLVCKSSVVHLAGFLDGAEPFTIPHTPRLFVTNKLDYDFDPEPAPPTRWLTFLDELWPSDMDSQNLLQEFFGYCLTPDTSMQKFLMLVGMSRGGKGTITNLLSDLVGRANFCSIRLKQFPSRFGLENAVGKSLIIVPDATMPSADRATAAVELFKAIVGCDPVDVDRKGRPIVTARLPAKIVMSTNDAIALPDNSAAFYNRMLVLKFTKSFLGREDTKLEEKLRAELSGILRWSVDGYARLRERGFFTEPKSGKVLKYRLLASGSPVALFVQDRCIVSSDLVIDKDELHKAYRRYCLEFEINAEEAPEFSKKLIAAVPSIDPDHRPAAKDGSGTRPRYYRGIGLKPDLDEAGSVFQAALDCASFENPAEYAATLSLSAPCDHGSLDTRYNVPALAV